MDDKPQIPSAARLKRVETVLEADARFKKFVEDRTVKVNKRGSDETVAFSQGSVDVSLCLISGGKDPVYASKAEILAAADQVFNGVVRAAAPAAQVVAAPAAQPGVSQTHDSVRVDIKPNYGLAIYSLLVGAICLSDRETSEGTVERRAKLTALSEEYQVLADVS